MSLRTLAPKLFIGQIPRHVGEEHLRTLFDPFGEIVSLSVLRDPLTGVHKGCAFLTYAAAESAEAAIRGMHEQLSLHHRPLVVRYAGMMHAPIESKLFVGMRTWMRASNTLPDPATPCCSIRLAHFSAAFLCCVYSCVCVSVPYF